MVYLTALLMVFSFLSLGSAQAAELSKKEAYRLLQNNSFKWEQTMLPGEDADAKNLQAVGARAFHLSAYSREYIGRLNQIQFGFATPGDLTIFTAGTTGVEFTYNIFDAAASERILASIENQKLSSYTTQQYQSDLTYVMLMEFLNFQRLKKRSEVIVGNIERAKEFVNIVQAKVRTGFGIAVEAKRALAVLHREQVRRLDTENQLAKARQDFTDLLGLRELPSEPPSLTVKTIKVEAPAKVQARALELRPEIKVAEFSLSASKDLKESEEKERWPKFTFMGDVGVFGTHVLGGVGNAVNGTVGLQLSMPLLDGGYYKGKIQEDDVKVRNFEIEAEQQKASVSSEAVQAVNQLKTTEEALSLAKSGVELSFDELHLMTRKYRSGSASGLDVASSQSNLTSALETDLDAQFAYEMSKVNYFKASGNFKDYFETEGGSP